MHNQFFIIIYMIKQYRYKTYPHDIDINQVNIRNKKCPYNYVLDTLKSHKCLINQTNDTKR